MRYIVIFMLCILLASCFKYINIDNSLRYTVTGFGNVTIDQNDSGSLYISINLLSGDPTNEYITTTVSGVPANVTVNQDSLVFRPNYGFELTFYGQSPKPGVYPIAVTMTSPTVGTKTYTFNLTVTSLVDCSSQITANTPYQYYADTTNSYYNKFTAVIVRAGCDTISFYIEHDSITSIGPESTQFLQFSAVINCSANTLYIYPQKAIWPQPSSDSIRGRGTFLPATATTSTITVYDTVYSGSKIISVNMVHIF